MWDEVPSVKQFWQHYRVVILVMMCLVLVTLVTRLTLLDRWPIFADEAIYVRWAQVMRSEATLRFLPQSDGKQPLYMWLVIPAMKLLDDPMIAGRTVSAFAGVGSVIGMFFLGKHLAEAVTMQKRLFGLPWTHMVGLTAAVLYVIVPYTVMFDRLALADSLLAMWGIWAMALYIPTVGKPRLDVSMMVGGILGLAWLTKSPAMFYLGLIPVSWILVFPEQVRSWWLLVRQFVSWVIIGVIAFGMYNILRLGPEFHQIRLRNADYIYSVGEAWSKFDQIMVPNLSEVGTFFWFLLTPGGLILMLLGIWYLWRTDWRRLVFLSVWLLMPILLQSFMARAVTARYFLYVIPAALLLASFGFVWVAGLQLKRRWLTPVLLLLVLLPLLVQDYLLITNPAAAWLPRRERSGYFEEWTSGPGLQEIADYVAEVAETSSVVLVTEGFFGTTPDGLQIYFNHATNVTVIGSRYIADEIPGTAFDSLTNNRVFFVINDERLQISDEEKSKLQLIKSYPKGVRPDGSQQYLLFFELVEGR